MRASEGVVVYIVCMHLPRPPAGGGFSMYLVGNFRSICTLFMGGGSYALVSQDILIYLYIHPSHTPFPFSIPKKAIYT